MPKPSPDTTAGHVVHLVERLDEATSAPASLLLPAHLGPRGRVVCAFLAALVTVGATGAIFLLWSNETPGGWFKLIFTAMLAGIAVAAWAILIGSGREARLDRSLQVIWERSRHHARADRGNVMARQTSLAEDGGVSSFELTVALDGGTIVSGRWRPHKSSNRLLLQQQVPGVGSEVRVWRVAADAGQLPAPLVIQAADPSVVKPRQH